MIVTYQINEYMQSSFEQLGTSSVLLTLYSSESSCLAGSADRREELRKRFGGLKRPAAGPEQDIRREAPPGSPRPRTTRCDWLLSERSVGGGQRQCPSESCAFRTTFDNPDERLFFDNNISHHRPRSQVDRECCSSIFF